MRINSKVQENAGDQVGIGFSFASDLLREWSEFLWTNHRTSKAKPTQSQITFNTQLKIALLNFLSCLAKLQNKRINQVEESIKIKPGILTILAYLTK